MKNFIIFFFIISFLYSSIANSSPVNQIKIGTGNKNALAYPILSSICEIFNKYNLDKKTSCIAVSTGGSEDNLNGIINGKYDAGVIKADMEYNAYNGIGIFANKPYRDLRNIIGLHSEYLTLIVKNNINIKSFEDFKNRRIYIGNKGSGSRILVDKLFKDNGWSFSNFKEIYEDEPDKIYDLFCNNKIDGAIYLVGHPNKIFAKTLKECNVKLIGFSRKEMEQYVDSFRYMSPAIIKKGTYPNQNLDINSFSSQLLLATSTKIDEKIIYNFVEIVSENFQELQSQNLALKNSLLFGQEINVIPLHKGAEKFLSLCPSSLDCSTPNFTKDSAK